MHLYLPPSQLSKICRQPVCSKRSLSLLTSRRIDRVRDSTVFESGNWSRVQSTGRNNVWWCGWNLLAVVVWSFLTGEEFPCGRI